MVGTLRKDDGVFNNNNNNKKRTFSAFTAGLVGFFILTIFLTSPTKQPREMTKFEVV